MRKILTAIISFLTVVVVVTACGGSQKKSPFDELLQQAPFKIYSDSIKQFPKNDTLYFRRAILLNSNNFADAALADFEKAWSLSKKEQYAVGISTLLTDKKSDNAISFIQQSLKTLPESNLLRIALAKQFNEKGNVEEAMKVCDEVLQVNPQQVDIIKIKAELLDKKGQPNEAIKILEQAYSLTHYDIDLNYELAYKYAETKNPAVLKLCDSLAKVDTANNHAEPAYYKGIYYANTGDTQNAINQFNKALENDYYFQNAYIEKGRIQFETKDIPAALKTFEKINKLSPDFADAWYWIGKCQEAAGQKEEALINYERAFALDKTFAEAKQAADALKK